jgi:hypothetical protein
LLVVSSSAGSNGCQQPSTGQPIGSQQICKQQIAGEPACADSRPPTARQANRPAGRQQLGSLPPACRPVVGWQPAAAASSLPPASRSAANRSANSRLPASRLVQTADRQPADRPTTTWPAAACLPSRHRQAASHGGQQHSTGQPICMPQ